MIATGVARPSAHGQEMTSTLIARSSAYATLCPIASQITQTIAAMMRTAGTKTPDTLSAILAIGAFVAAASLTIWMIWENVVSSPILVAFARMKPDWLIVAADTLSPTALSTGIDSPVSADSSTAVFPSMISPSTGIDSPGFTTKISPSITSSMPTVTALPFLSTTAVFGAIFMRFFSASVVRPFDRDSSVLPTVISAGIIAADSKYS